MYKIIAVISLFLILNGCKKEPSRQNLLSPSNEIDYSVGYAVRNKFMGVYFDKNDSVDYIYFADPVTYKKIRFFTFDGKLKWDIPLDSMLTGGRGIDNISVISPDTIIGLSNYANVLYIINSKGICWRKVDLNTKLDLLGIGKYELYSSTYDDFTINDSTLLFEAGLILNYDTVMDNISNLEKYKILYEQLNERYKLFKITDLYNNPSIIAGLSKFYKDTSGNYFYPELPYYSSYNNRIFTFTLFDSTIYEIDPGSLTIIGKYEVKSDFTKIGYAPVEITDETIYGFVDIVNRDAKTKGRLNSIYFDNYSNTYLVTVMHTIASNSPDSVIGINRPWSLIIYNARFEKLDEILFTAGTYIPDIVILKEGILISTNLKKRMDYDKNISRFVLFRRNF